MIVVNHHSTLCMLKIYQIITATKYSEWLPQRITVSLSGACGWSKYLSLCLIIYRLSWHRCIVSNFVLLTCSLPSVPIPDPSALPPNRGLLVSLSTPPSPASGDSSTVVTWFIVAWGLEITVEFFMFSAVVTGACLLGFPPNNLQ